MINIYSPLEIDSDYFLTHDEEHELFYAKINALPPSIQDIFFNIDTEEAIKKLGSQFGFNNDQITALTRLVRDIALGDIYLGDLTGKLKVLLKIDENLAKTITTDLMSRVFYSALEDIKKMHIEKFKAPPPTVNPNNVLDLSKKNNP